MREWLRRSYFEVVVGEVVFQAEGVHALGEGLPGQLLDGVLLLTQLGEHLLHQHHLTPGTLPLHTHTHTHTQVSIGLDPVSHQADMTA